MENAWSGLPRAQSPPLLGGDIAMIVSLLRNRSNAERAVRACSALQARSLNKKRKKRRAATCSTFLSIGTRALLAVKRLEHPFNQLSFSAPTRSFWQGHLHLPIYQPGRKTFGQTYIVEQSNKSSSERAQALASLALFALLGGVLAK